MNTSKDISLYIYKNIYWTWLHLASTVLLNALIYSSFRTLEFAVNLSLTISIIGIAVGLIIANIKFPKPNQSKQRFYWAAKVIYQVCAFLMLLISVQSILLFIVWLSVLVLIWCAFLVVVFARSFSTHYNKLRSERKQNSETYKLTDLTALNYKIILLNEMEQQQVRVNQVALLTGVDENRILRFTTGEEKPTEEEAKTLLTHLGVSEKKLKNYYYISNPSK